MLETIHEFAREKLGQSREAEQISGFTPSTSLL